MRKGHDYLGILLGSAAWAAAVLAAGAYGDQGHDARRAIACASAAVAVGCLAVLAARAVRQPGRVSFSALVAWRALTTACEARSLAGQNATRISRCESRQSGLFKTIELAGHGGGTAGAPAQPHGLHLVPPAAPDGDDEDEAAG